ncbi:MAG: hypothetical protein KDC54_21830 [Lewinella sp.]|nr:hypothetical protein [Lewinella sp.]
MQPKNWITFFLMSALLTTSALLTSCERDADTPDEVITNDEAAELIEGALQADSEGLAEEMLLATELAESAVNKNLTTLACNETRDSSFTRTLNESYLTASYSSTFSWTLLCNSQDLPTAIEVARQTTGNYESQRWISDDEASGSWTVSQLLFGSSYIINGEYARTGYQESKVREMRTFDSTISFTIEDLYVDKGTQRISSGTGTFTMAGEGSDGNSFDLSGTIVFHGGGSATVIINGQQYTIDLY